MAETDHLLLRNDVTIITAQDSISQIVKGEFCYRKFGFHFDNKEVFLFSQWPCRYWLFIVYRVIMASYAVTITFLSIVGFDQQKERLPWPVWLTNWSYFMLTCHLLCSLLNVTLNAAFDRRTDQHSAAPLSSPSSTPFHIRLDAFFFCIAAPAAVVVTIVYFVAVFPMRHRGVTVGDINVHIMNSVLVLLELTVSALPIRLLHLVYMWLYGILYVVFSAVYWSFDHANVMYPGVLDWNSPKTTIVVLIVLLFVGIPVLQMCLFLIYRLRVFLHLRFVRGRVHSGAL